MNLAQEIEKQKKQKQNKKKREKAMQGFLLYVIYYPFFYPFEKFIEKIKEQKISYWRKNIDKLRIKALKEAVSYISDEMIRSKSCVVYNARHNEDIDYGNAFYLRNFFGYSFHYRKKENKLSQLYCGLSEEKQNLQMFSKEEDQFYDQLFKDLINMFKSTYHDIELEEKIEKTWGKEYKICVISIKN